MPPTPGEELDLSTAFSAESIAETPLKNGGLQRKHTDLGWEGRDFTYTPLSKEQAVAEMERLSSPKVSHNGTTHTASLQPHPKKHSQDRHIAENWDLQEGGIWKFRALFDGKSCFSVYFSN